MRANKPVSRKHLEQFQADTPVPTRAHLEKYELSLAEYDDLLNAQGGRCAICKDPPELGERLRIDHDHQTNMVRGLLCHHCNVGLGFFRDSPALLARAVVYVQDA